MLYNRNREIEMDRQISVSKHLLDKVALVFLHHPGQAYSRADIQEMLKVSKPTACRVLSELVIRLGLEEIPEGRIIYYRLPEVEAKRFQKSIDFILSVSDREQLALSFLLSYGKSSGLFSESIEKLTKKLEKAGLILSSTNYVTSTQAPTQSISPNTLLYIDTLISATETKTAIDIVYKSPFSSEEHTHLLWPVGVSIRSGNLYLYAYDSKYENATSYALSRIKELSLRYDEHYTIPSSISLEEAIKDPFGVALRKPERVTVLISPKQAFYEKEKAWPSGTQITEVSDGAIEIEMTISDPYAFKTWALSLGKECKVLSPYEYTEWIRVEHEQAANLYEGG